MSSSNLLLKTMGFRAGLCTQETTIGDKPDTKNDVIKDESDPSTDMSTESEEKVTHSGYNYLITVPDKEIPRVIKIHVHQRNV